MAKPLDGVTVTSLETQVAGPHATGGQIVGRLKEVLGTWRPTQMS